MLGNVACPVRREAVGKGPHMRDLAGGPPSKNLVDTVEKVLQHHRTPLKTAAVAVLREQQARAVAAAPHPQPPIEVRSAPPAALISEPCLAALHRATRYARDRDGLALHQEGLSLAGIARQMQLTRATVRGIVRGGIEGAEAGRVLAASNFRPFESYLWQRWTAGCQNAHTLWREVQALGYRGSYVHLRRALRT